MLAGVYVDHPSDEPFWITRRDFAKYFDQYDFVFYRTVQEVQVAYRRDWFIYENGRVSFQLPVVSFVGSRTQFINGRHRTAVLLSVQDAVPIALTTNLLDARQLELRSSIPKSPIKRTDLIELPDLPFIEGE